tara:strand:+ start:7448 stop:7912 length:465 start_codon:yes stop_codon:yes gene_type:complete
MIINATLCFIKKNNKVLLQKKAKGLYGEHKYNAPGGKLKPNESPESGVAREVKEETGLSISNLTKHGQVAYYENNPHSPAWVVHVFSTNNFSGEIITNNREGILEWIHQDNMPYDKMWANDKDWISLLLQNKKFKAEFHFDEKEQLIKKEINIV